MRLLYNDSPIKIIDDLEKNRTGPGPQNQTLAKGILEKSVLTILVIQLETKTTHSSNYIQVKLIPLP